MIILAIFSDTIQFLFFSMQRVITVYIFVSYKKYTSEVHDDKRLSVCCVVKNNGLGSNTNTILLEFGTSS